jgi:hypothetical protein
MIWPVKRSTTATKKVWVEGTLAVLGESLKRAVELIGDLPAPSCRASILRIGDGSALVCA